MHQKKGSSSDLYPARLSAHPRHDLFGKTLLLLEERLKLQHKRGDADLLELPNPSRDGVVTADQARRRPTIGADVRIFRRGLEHLRLRIDVRVKLRPIFLLFLFPEPIEHLTRFDIPLSRDDECRQSESDRA